jgi:ribonucleotide monophosphatase NagD (HAD superfamily)
MATERGGGPVLAFTGPGVDEPLRERGVEVLALDEAERAAAVLIGWDSEFGQAKLEAACRAVEAGAELLLSSPARRFAGRERPQVGLSGAIAAGITFVTGAVPIVIGKPSERVISMVSRRLGVAPADLLVVGDDPDLEVGMGRRAGCLTALVLTGVADRSAALALDGERRPDAILEGVGDLVPAPRAALRRVSTSSTRRGTRPDRRPGP